FLSASSCSIPLTNPTVLTISKTSTATAITLNAVRVLRNNRLFNTIRLIIDLLRGCGLFLKIDHLHAGRSGQRELVVVQFYVEIQLLDRHLDAVLVLGTRHSDGIRQGDAVLDIVV